VRCGRIEARGVKPEVHERVALSGSQDLRTALADRARAPQLGDGGRLVEPANRAVPGPWSP
jgi:hypothetical protein